MALTVDVGDRSMVTIKEYEKSNKRESFALIFVDLIHKPHDTTSQEFLLCEWKTKQEPLTRRVCNR